MLVREGIVVNTHSLMCVCVCGFLSSDTKEWLNLFPTLPTKEKSLPAEDLFFQVFCSYPNSTKELIK